MRIAIAGAGLGGLTTALCLQEAGHDVAVLEQATKLEEVGAGIQLGANAVRVLESLSLEKSIADVAVMPKSIDFRDFRTGRYLHKIDLGERYQQRYGSPYIHIHRADLHEILLNACQSRYGDIIKLDSRVKRYTESSSGVVIERENSSDIEADCLIGCDGIKSVVRSQLLGTTESNWTGNVAWRGVVDATLLPEGFMDRVVTNFVGPGKHMVIYYLRRQKLLNFVGVVKNADWSDESWVAKAPWEELREDFRGWHPTVETLINYCNKDECYRWALYNHRPVNNWSSNRVTLLGDAAHATLPFMASGAAMAIEDARILQRSLGVSDSLHEALSIYQRNRIGRTKKIQINSERAGNLYHLPGAWLRAAAFKVASLSRSSSDFLASYDANKIHLY